MSTHSNVSLTPKAMVADHRDCRVRYRCYRQASLGPIDDLNRQISKQLCFEFRIQEAYKITQQASNRMLVCSEGRWTMRQPSEYSEGSNGTADAVAPLLLTTETGQQSC